MTSWYYDKNHKNRIDLFYFYVIVLYHNSKIIDTITEI